MLWIYYTNLFLVLGDYVLVMSHAVKAMTGGTMCLPTAGLLASTLMFAISQLNHTMALLGRTASTVSLLCLLVVLVQCLWALQTNDGTTPTSSPPAQSQERPSTATFHSVWAKLAALGSIGFAVGSQKLFLNIRHEMKDRRDAPYSLATSLSAFGGLYVLVCVLAGQSECWKPDAMNRLSRSIDKTGHAGSSWFLPFSRFFFLPERTVLFLPLVLTVTPPFHRSFPLDPPGLLLDAIPIGTTQRAVAGLLLWIHVAVSYAINSQALCASLDRLCLLSYIPSMRTQPPKRRWLFLTLGVATASYLLSNAVPFFQNLVSLIGALTSVPLTTTAPALLYRKVMPTILTWSSTSSSSTTTITTSAVIGGGGYRTRWWLCLARWGSIGLLLYSIIFLVGSLSGSLFSIEQSWAKSGRAPFSCDL